MASAATVPSLLNIYIVTFNCALTLIDVDAFAAHLFRPYTDRESRNLPDILVLNLEEVAPLAYSFLGGTFLTPYFTRFIQAVQRASNPLVNYRHVASHNAGTTGILVFARPEITPHIRWFQTADVGVGHWAMGNKGAAGVRLGYSQNHNAEPIPLTFVAAHLAAMEDGLQRRNLDWENIVRGLAFKPASQKKTRPTETDDQSETEAEPLIADSSTSRMSMFTSGSPIFFAGDLNYRSSDKGPEPGQQATFPQPTRDRNDPKHYSHLFKNEQLSREVKAGRTLHHLSESKVDFPPTYKFSTEQQALALKDIDASGGEATAWFWSSHRWPSWTDRIFFSASLAGSAKALKVIEYGPLPIQPTSDHRPVVLALELDTTLAESLTEDNDPPFSLNPQWEQLRASSRRLEIGVGILTYLGHTWEGNGLILATVVGAVGGWLVMQGLVS